MLRPIENLRQILKMYILLWVIFAFIYLEDEFGNDILTKKIGIGFKEGTCKYSLRDRYGDMCDRLLNTCLTIAQSLGFEGNEFGQAINEVVGDSRIYDGEYDRYYSFSFRRFIRFRKGFKKVVETEKLNPKFTYEPYL